LLDSLLQEKYDCEMSGQRWDVQLHVDQIKR